MSPPLAVPPAPNDVRVVPAPPPLAVHEIEPPDGVPLTVVATPALPAVTPVAPVTPAPPAPTV